MFSLIDRETFPAINSFAHFPGVRRVRLPCPLPASEQGQIHLRVINGGEKNQAAFVVPSSKPLGYYSLVS